MSEDTFESLQVNVTFDFWPSRWKIGVWNWDLKLSKLYPYIIGFLITNLAKTWSHLWSAIHRCSLVAKIFLLWRPSSAKWNFFGKKSNYYCHKESCDDITFLFGRLFLNLDYFHHNTIIAKIPINFSTDVVHFCKNLQLAFMF